MTRNKRSLSLLIALGAAFTLASCDSIEALPNNYNDPIIVNSDETNADVYDNIMGVLYDAISSNKKDDVLNKFIEIIAKDQFGEYKDIKALLAENDDEKIKAFIENHKGAYVHTNTVTVDGEDKEEDTYLAETFGVTVDEIRKQRLQNFLDSIEEKINETFYNEITSDSYKDSDGKFYEERLARAHYAEMYDVDITKTDWNEGFLTPELKKEDVSEFIHLDDGRYDDYIEKNIVRSVYKDKLVEQYLLENNYSTLGRAYGRKVNMIKLTRGDKDQDLPEKLLQKFADTYINVETPNVDFEIVANAWRGFEGLNKDGSAKLFTNDSAETALLEASGFTKVVVGANVYFKETQYGLLQEKIEKAEKAAQGGRDGRYATTEEKEAYSELTNSYAYTLKKGITVALAKLALEDYTTDGWYVKNGGLTDLPDAIRNRLFNINVSNELDNKNHVESQTDYLKVINGHYYLTPSASETSSNYNYIIYNDGSYYLIEVQEAVSTSKLNLTNKDSYVNMLKSTDPLFTEEIAHELAETLGTKDSYINNAYASYIEQYSLVYHDSAIYDYFKEKYPELFD